MKIILKVTIIFLMLSLLNKEVLGFEEFKLNKDVNIPSVNYSFSDTNSEVNGDFKSIPGGSDEEFDSTLPQTPPPPEINIPRPSAIEEEFLKGVSFYDDFDIKDYSKIPYLMIITKNAKEQNMDLELVLAIIKKESNFNPKAKSSVGALGLMQLMPETAKWLGLKNTSKLTDPDVNTKYGIKYLRYLFSEISPKVSYSELDKEDIERNEIKKVLAGYNAGPGNVKKYDKPPYYGIPPFKETRDYVKKVPFYFIKFEELSIPK